MNRLILVIGAAALICLSACSRHSFFANHAQRDYLKAKNGPGLSVPPGLHVKGVNHDYYLSAPVSPQAISLVPPGNDAIKTKEHAPKKGK